MMHQMNKKCEDEKKAVALRLRKHRGGFYGVI